MNSVFTGDVKVIFYRQNLLGFMFYMSITCTVLNNSIFLIFIFFTFIYHEHCLFSLRKNKTKINRMSLVMRKVAFAYAKTKSQISCAVTGQLISAFAFATGIVESLFFLDPKFQASSHRLWLYSPDCVGPGRKS